MPSNRNALVHQVLGAVRELSATAVLFQAALAESRGLSFVEAKALDLLERFGPLTAGELSLRSGLAPASVTGLVDRLVRKGLVRRGPHPRDGRRVLIQTVAGTVGNGPGREYALSVRDLCAEYTNDQLAAIASFTAAVARRSAEITARLHADR
ncbi:MAG TPA: MarR family transcriptional regulator [Pseudonocardiaceae bacterium]|jgi:DNA-binding transcriptional ArsR family regulator|nr:MarR family transcriptional regulator [Pseudonocardiaceae bacterium]